MNSTLCSASCEERAEAEPAAAAGPAHPSPSSRGPGRSFPHLTPSGANAFLWLCPGQRGRAGERSWWAAEGERAATPKTASPAGGWHRPETRREGKWGGKGPEHPEVTESQAVHARSPRQKEIALLFLKSNGNGREAVGSYF